MEEEEEEEAARRHSWGGESAAVQVPVTTSPLTGEREGFEPHAGYFPAPAKTRYRWIVLLPLMSLLSLVTLVPPLVAAIVWWGECASLAWYINPNAFVVAVNVVQIVCSITLGSRALAGLDNHALALSALGSGGIPGLDVPTRSFATAIVLHSKFTISYAAVILIVGVAKVAEGVLIALTIYTGWCNGVIISLVDLLAFTFFLAAHSGFVRKPKDSEISAILGYKGERDGGPLRFYRDCARGSIYGVMVWALVLSAIGVVLVPAASVGVGALALDKGICEMSIWSPSISIVATGSISVILAIMAYMSVYLGPEAENYITTGLMALMTVVGAAQVHCHAGKITLMSIISCGHAVAFVCWFKKYCTLWLIRTRSSSHRSSFPFRYLQERG